MNTNEIRDYLLNQFPETIKMYTSLYAKWRTSCAGTYRKVLHDAMNAIEGDIEVQSRFNGQNPHLVIESLREYTYN